MENFDSKKYRDSLASDLKEIRKDNPEMAQKILKEERGSIRYDLAENEMPSAKYEELSKFQARVKDSIREVFFEQNGFDIKKSDYLERGNFSSVLTRGKDLLGDNFLDKCFSYDEKVLLSQEIASGYRSEKKLALKNFIRNIKEDKEDILIKLKEFALDKKNGCLDSLLVFKDTNPELLQDNFVDVEKSFAKEFIKSMDSEKEYDSPRGRYLRYYNKVGDKVLKIKKDELLQLIDENTGGINFSYQIEKGEYGSDAKMGILFELLGETKEGLEALTDSQIRNSLYSIYTAYYTGYGRSVDSFKILNKDTVAVLYHHYAKNVYKDGGSQSKQIDILNKDFDKIATSEQFPVYSVQHSDHWTKGHARVNKAYNHQNPENDFKEIVDVEENVIKVLNSSGQQIEIPIKPIDSESK